MSIKDIPDELVLKAMAFCHAQNMRIAEEHPNEIWGIGGPKEEVPWPYDLLAEWTGQPVKVCYRAMERAAERDLIEYGVSLRTGWLTEKGKALLAKVFTVASQTVLDPKTEPPLA